jgi:hypothetical protein
VELLPNLERVIAVLDLEVRPENVEHGQGDCASTTSGAARTASARRATATGFTSHLPMPAVLRQAGRGQRGEGVRALSSGSRAR